MKKFLYLFLLLPVIVAAQTDTKNYVSTYVYKDRTTTPDATKAQVGVTYVDGLGRPIQQVAGKASATGKDIVTHIEYDKYNRTQREYLPYVPGTADLSFTDGVKAATISQYTSSAELENTANPYSRTMYEASPLNRVMKKAAPGNPWAMDTVANNDHTIKFAYLTNTVDDKVAKRSVLATWDPMYNIYKHGAYPGSGNYAPGELYKTITQDENKTGNIYTGSSPANDAALKYNTVEEFKNKEGQLVLKRTFNNGLAHNTYYFYDQFGNLSYVCPPMGGGMFSSDIRTTYGYQYKYDARNRLAEKKLPGKGWEFIVYDPLDRVIATGPALNPFGGTDTGWLYTYYDVFGRVALTGWVPQSSMSSTKRNTLQQATTTVNNVVRGPQTVDGVPIDYKPGTLPTGFKLLTVNYYDNYTWPGGLTTLPSTVEGENVRTNVQGLATGSWIRVLTSATAQLADITYTLYDTKGRPIRSRIKNYLGGYTMADSKLDFDGKAQYTITSHKRVTGDTEIIVREDFTYTEQDRLLSHTHTINSLAPELMGLNEYTDLGQLKSKKVGGADLTGAVPLQKVDYTYNVRGLLKEINNADNLLGTGQPQDLFAFKINYNDAITYNTTNTATPLYNGNIAETTWRTAGDNIQRRYTYSYDMLNRLTDAWYQMPEASYPERHSYDERLQYDKNGNITSLQRNGGLDTESMPVEIDNLAYTTYLGNQLMKVTDNSLSTQGFKDGTNTDNDFQYDDYGNMTVDQNKGITSISYNHLNLPVKIVFNSNETKKIEYLYDAVGTKVKKTVTDGTSIHATDYISGFQYVNTLLQLFPTAEGYVKYTQPRAVNDPGMFNYVYNYTDHLGNIRLSYTLDPQDNVLKILEENHYYPFGLKHKGYLSEQNIIVTQPEGIVIVPAMSNDYIAYNYKYNGKELQDELGLNMYDYGARNYDPAIGRWMNIDPLAEKYYGYTPYNYTINNPLSHIDPDGRDIENITGGVKFTGNDAVTAFKAISRQIDAGGVKGFHFVYETKTPNIYRHTLNSFRNGKPNVLHYDSDKKRQADRRTEALKNHVRKPGLSPDEYPYASTFEGGTGADVADVPLSEQRAQGGSLGGFGGVYSKLESGDAFMVIPVPKNREPEPEPELIPVPTPDRMRHIDPSLHINPPSRGQIRTIGIGAGLILLAMILLSPVGA